MTGGYTHPIYYERVVSVDQGSVIIRYNENDLIIKKRFLRRGSPSRSPAATFQARLCGESNPALPQPCVKHDRRMHSSDTRGVVSVKKGSVIIRYKSYHHCGIVRTKLLHVDSTSAINWTKKKAKVSRGHVSSMTKRGVERWSPAAMFQAWEGGIPIRYTIRELSVLRKEAW